MLAISFYFVNCVIISCKLSFNSRFTRNQIPIMSFLGFIKAELGCKMSELTFVCCKKAELGCHNTKVNMLQYFDARGRTNFTGNK